MYCTHMMGLLISSTSMDKYVMGEYMMMMMVVVIYDDDDMMMITSCNTLL